MISKVNNVKYFEESDGWDIVKFYFKYYGLVRHQIDSFDHFIQNSMQEIIDDMPPIIMIKNVNSTQFQKKNNKKVKMVIRFGQLHLARPTFIEESGTSHTLMPNEARLRNLTYSSPLYCDVYKTLVSVDENDETAGEVVISQDLEKVLIGRIPIMIKSRFCVLNKQGDESLIKYGECVSDPGGYFIINGSEKVIVAQDNYLGIMYIFSRKQKRKNPLKHCRFIPRKECYILPNVDLLLILENGPRPC